MKTKVMQRPRKNSSEIEVLSRMLACAEGETVFLTV